MFHKRVRRNTRVNSSNTPAPIINPGPMISANSMGLLTSSSKNSPTPPRGAIKAQHRPYKKSWRLDNRKHRHVAITAVARELCGFIWAILNAVQ